MKQIARMIAHYNFGIKCFTSDQSDFIVDFYGKYLWISQVGNFLVSNDIIKIIGQRQLPSFPTEK